jgi:hypothetical protein
VSVPSGVPLTGTGYGPRPPTASLTVTNGGAQEACAAAATGLTCPVGHLDRDGLRVRSATPAASARPAIPIQANNTASETDVATGIAVQIGLTPVRPRCLARLRVGPVRLTLAADGGRPAPARVEALLSEPTGALATRTPASRPRRPARRRPPTCRTIALDVALPEHPHGRTLTPGRYDLSAVPTYFPLPAGTLAATSPQPVTPTIEPGACVGTPLRASRRSRP